MLTQLDVVIGFIVIILGISLLITVLNQMVVALLGLRGTSLRWGVETLLLQLDPKLNAHARTMSHEILKCSLISDSTWSRTMPTGLMDRLLNRWKLASAIRVDELLNVLRRLATPEAGQASSDWQTRLAKILRDNDEQAAQRLEAASKTLQKFAPLLGNQIATAAPQVVASVQKAVGDIELWFDAVMDRVSQRFVVRMRLWTIVFSVLVAFFLHLDASTLLLQIRLDPELRASLVASADRLTEQAEKVVSTSVQSVFPLAMKRLQNEVPELKPAGEPPAFVRVEEGREWLRQHAPRRDELIARYDQLVQAELKATVRELAQDAQSIRESLAESGVQLIPDYSRHRRPDNWPDWWLFNRHFFGILATAALLSLGAPFWFNALKTLTNLRPIVAGKEKAERENA